MVSLDQLVPSHHLLRRLDQAIDLNFIYALSADLYCENNGRPAIDPLLFFRMQLIGYLYGINSDRRLCEEIHLNLAYRWFCRLNLEDDVPDHSSLTRIRDRFGEDTYRKIFERILTCLRHKGAIKGQRMISDASLVEADAAMDSLVGRQEADPGSRELRRYEKRYHDFREGKKARKISNQTHISKSDPDATIVSRQSSYPKLCYKVHYSVDASSRIIVDCHATTGARHECVVLPERIDYLTRQLQLPVNELLADKGYGRGPTYKYLREHRIRAYIPLHDERMGESSIGRENFVYDRKHDRYVCPENHYLYPYPQLDNGLKRYRVLGRHCRSCPVRDSCLPASQKHRARIMWRNPHQDEIDQVRSRQQTRHFKRKLIERRWKIEGLFAEAKANHCLKRAKYRGLKKTQIQFYMIAIVQNLKRLVTHVSFLFWIDIFLKTSRCAVRAAAVGRQLNR